MRRRLAALVLVTTTPLALVACSDDDTDGGASGDATSTSETSTAEHNEADVEFAQEMIPHHAQAILMSRMAEARAETPGLRALAERIEAAQAPEIERMSGWLEAWGEDVPSGTGHGMGDGTGHGGMDHGGTGDGMGDGMGDGGGMPGMMDPDDLDELRGSRGDGWDDMWLEMMIDHHEGAIGMSEELLEEGESPAVRELAEQIISDQTAEIAEMEAMVAAS